VTRYNGPSKLRKLDQTSKLISHFTCLFIYLFVIYLLLINYFAGEGCGVPLSLGAPGHMPNVPNG
jgi:hypothetical protein